MHENTKNPKIVKTISRRKNKTRGTTFPDFKQWYKLQQSKQHGTGIKTDTEIKVRQINSSLYGQLTKEKEAKIYNSEKTASSINGVGKTEQPHAQDSNWTTFSHPMQK